MKKTKVLDLSELNFIFSNIKDILVCQEQFIMELQKAETCETLDKKIVHLLYTYKREWHHLKDYETYCLQLNQAKERLSELQKNQDNFCQFLNASLLFFLLNEFLLTNIIRKQN